MTPDDGPDSHPDHRSTRDVPADAISLRQPEDEEGVFEVRMPIATTGEVRNDGDDPLQRDALEGMARQIEQRTVGVFLDHGRSPVGGRERYSAVEKVGEWTDATVRERDEQREADGDSARQAATDELVATARLMDPETLPNGVSDLRAAIGAIKEQVQRGFSLSSSIGWRDDEDFPGGVDLMEASIVGIGADPRTTSDAEAAVVARAAVDAGADPDRLLGQVRQAVAAERPLGPPDDPDRFDTFEECVQALMDDEDIDREAAERICGSWEAAKDDSASHDMTDDNESESADDDPADAEQSDDPDEQRQAPEWAEQMLELLEDTNSTLQSVAEAVRQDDDDDEEDDEDEDMDEGATDGDDDEDEEDEENAADEPAGEQSADDVAALSEELDAIREDLNDIRSGDAAVDTPDTDDEQSADDGEATETTDTDDTTWRQHA